MGLNPTWSALQRNLGRNTRHGSRSLHTGPGRKYKLELKTTKRTLEWRSRPYPTGNDQNRDYLFRPGTGLSTMLLKGGFSKASDIHNDPGVIYTQASDMAKDTKFQTEHVLELRIIKLLLQTACTGELPKADEKAATQFIKTPTITEENLFTGWHELYPSDINLDPVYEFVEGMPENYEPPENSPAGRSTTALGDWGNLQNLAVATGDINAMKGKLFGLENPIGKQKLRNLLDAALENDKAAAKEIGRTFKDVLRTSDMLEKGVSPKMAALGTPLGKLVQTTRHYSRIRNHLRWNGGGGGYM
ncbi:hypothetical protein F5144DRAFT_546326 [Chaetomium tenue]|uniref:Uncharacterized protein n=1 Tax=Chaetomium tenue TaxID=1854479 RepID=A0ACB7PD03_9PEZI|nr:hypothetical protein F5144DRAFT_546326 [Chaetomium globosum]